MDATRFVQFIVKVSKLCNLRCRYCYEFPELAKKEAMSLEQLRTMYEHVRDYYIERDRADGVQTEARFIWHGGEPLLMKPEFYRQTFADQRRIFGDRIPVMNIVQTNLTVLDDERLELLRSGFDKVGVSIDLFGALREDVSGRDSQERVLRNMETLRRAGVPFGCITVLTQKNRAHIEQIFRFYERAGIEFRILPLFDGAFADQHASYDVTTQEVLDSYRKLVDLWFDNDDFVGANPIVEHVQVVLGHLAADHERTFYSRRAWIPTILVNTNGDCYGYGDPYGDPTHSYGNIFESPLATLFTSETFVRSVRASEQRMARNCVGCPFFGACDGYPIAEDLTNCRESDGDGVRRCVLERGILHYIEEQVRRRGLVDASGHLAVNESRARRLGMLVAKAPAA